MRNQINWLQSLPIGLALRLMTVYAVRKLFRLPIGFSYAQGAEDLIIPYLVRYHFAISEPGTYIDVGCNEPVRYSNTFDLYLRGWRGVNIDANRDLIEECRRVRKQDVCVLAAVSDAEREVTFHKAKSNLVSTIDETKLVEWKMQFEFSDDDQETVTTQTLTAILDRSWKHGDSIDLLTIDAEGHDLQVLKGLDLKKYRPKIVVIEIHDFETPEKSEIHQYLSANGYKLKFFAIFNAYFVDEHYG